MKVIVCTSVSEDKKFEAFLNKTFSESQLEILPAASFSRSCKRKAGEAIVYFDASLGEDKILSLAAKLDEVENSVWGVLDKAGAIADPAALFFEGACDYLGPALCKAGIGEDRLESVLAFAGLEGEEAEAPEALQSFAGWDSLKVGQEVGVRFCYASLGNQAALLERIGEKRLFKLRQDFTAFLAPWAKELGGIVWIDSGAGCLILFPPQDESLRGNPVLAAFRMLLDRAIIGYEIFRLEVPLSFRFAFHKGSTIWQKPGFTGRVVAEDVNFIFHLGAKHAPDASIAVSEEARDSVPPNLADLFSPAEAYEGHGLFQSHQFED